MGKQQPVTSEEFIHIIKICTRRKGERQGSLQKLLMMIMRELGVVGAGLLEQLWHVCEMKKDENKDFWVLFCTIKMHFLRLWKNLLGEGRSPQIISFYTSRNCDYERPLVASLTTTCLVICLNMCHCLKLWHIQWVSNTFFSIKLPLFDHFPWESPFCCLSVRFIWTDGRWHILHLVWVSRKYAQL